ncbi:MAG: DUF5696 domain-containing protein [Oscillospiraceae bacterium]|jgi:hypothetical protein|nr:DUF5696 domain-containing protein [Oscillospiraceae bacterium]
MKQFYEKGRCLLSAVFFCAALLGAGSAETAGSVGGESSETAERAETADSGEGVTLVAENTMLALYVRVETGNVSVLDKRNGQIWYACPPDVGDGLLGSFSASLQSLLNVSYSYQGGQQVTVGSYDRENAMTRRVFKITDGVRLLFSYSREGITFSVPVLVKLREDYISCEADTAAIEESGDVQLTKLSLFPNFGAARADSEGYSLIPDGSGALILNEDAKGRDVYYEEPVYGEDPSRNLLAPETSAGGSDIRMPVYGFARPDGACLAVICRGDASSSVFASMQYDYLRCGAIFAYREEDLTGVRTKDGDTRLLSIVQDKPLAVSPSVRYYFLSGGDADYSGMARRYRAYLEEEQGLTRLTQAEAVPMAVEAFGGVMRKSGFLGIPMNRMVRATSFAQLETLQAGLESGGIKNTQWLLYGFLSGGFENKQHSAPVYENGLGGAKGWKSALKALGASNVFTVYDTSRRYHSGTAWFGAGGVKSLNQTTVERYNGKPSNGSKREDFGVWTYRSIDALNLLTSKIIKKAPENSGLAFAYMGGELYSDFSAGGGFSRGELMAACQSVMERASARPIRTAVEGGGVYLAAHADLLYEIPLTGGGHRIEGVSVPFYSMVLHGLVPLASQPINNRTDAGEYCLRAFEQGVSVLCRVTGCDSWELKDTKLNFLYNTGFENALALGRSETLRAYGEVHAALAAQTVTRHHYEGELSVTAYENGWEIAVNYGARTAEYKGRSIRSGGYEVFTA